MRKLGFKELNNLPKVSQMVSGRVRTQDFRDWAPNLCAINTASQDADETPQVKRPSTRCLQLWAPPNTCRVKRKHGAGQTGVSAGLPRL